MNRRPRVIANFAITADGKVSTKNFTAAGFTSPADKRRLLEIRSLGDAVLAGAATVSKDTMSMGISVPDLRKERRKAGLPEVPLRVVVSNRGDLSPSAKVFQNRMSQVVVFSTSRMAVRQRQVLAGLCDLWLFEAREVPLAESLRILHREYRVKTLICEGGPRLLRALLEIEAVDELRLTVAPRIFGGAAAPTLTGLCGDFLKKAARFRLREMEARGGECYLRFLRRRH